MLIEKVFPSGAWSICETIDGHLKQRLYYDYTKKEAIAEFKNEFKQNPKGWESV